MKYKIILPFTVFLIAASTQLPAFEKPVTPDKPVPINPLLAQRSGYAVDSFLVKPELAIIGIYDNNIFATRSNTVSDHLLLISPSLDIQSNWDRHQLNFSSSADLARYDDRDTEDYDDFRMGTSGRYDFSQFNNVFAGFNYRQGHESRASPDSFFGRNPTVFSSKEAHVGTVQRFDDIAMRLGGTFQNLDFKDVPTNTVPVNHDDRDRDLYGIGLRFSYVKDLRLQPFLQFIYDRREYIQPFDDNGFQRASDGYRVAAGLGSAIGNRLRAEVYGGYLWQNFTDNRFESLRKPDFGASVRWKASASTMLSATVDRAVEETTLAGSSSAIETSYGADIRHKLLPDVMLKSHLNYSKYDYRQIQREDDYVDAGFGLEFNITRQVYLAGDYRYLHRDSNIGGAGLDTSQDYYRHQFFVTVGARLYPVNDELVAGLNRLWGESDASESGLAGLYLGLQYGYDGLATGTNELREHGGTDEGEFGDSGMVGGVFAGYGFNWNNWYLGLELEGETSNTKWYHTKEKTDSRTFWLEKNEAYGGSLRLGRSLLNDSMIYGRVGVVNTEFHSFYALNDQLQTAFDDDFTLTGLRFGVGLEFALSDHLFGRMDSTVTNYEDRQIQSIGFNDKFAIHESMFNLGIGWRFQPVSQTAVRFDADKLSGPYAGVQIGYGLTNSTLTGLHRDQGLGPFYYNVDFADHGFTPGVFAGYGINWRNLYMAVELDGEINSMRWEHIRDTAGGGGRDFWVEVKETMGISGKLGYILDNGTLLYVRGGGVRTEFSNHYEKGNNRSNDIDREVSLSGLRLGIGAEVPITELAFLRLDYSHTVYEPYEIVTNHGNGANRDEITFDTTTDLVRLGIGTRF